MGKVGDSEAREAAETLEKYCNEHVIVTGAFLIKEMYAITVYWPTKCRLTG